MAGTHLHHSDAVDGTRDPGPAGRAEERDPARAAGGGPDFSVRRLIPSLLPNVIVPWAIYQVLTARGASTIDALMATAVVPLAATLYGWARDRRVDALGIMVLAFAAVGLATSFISGDPFFYLIKESLLTGVWGLLFLGSLLVGRPLTFYFGRQLMAGDPERAAGYDSLWQQRSFRSSQRLLTALWGGGLIGEALVRVLLAYLLPIPVFLVVSPVMGIGVTVGLLILTGVYARRMDRRRAPDRALRVGG